MPPNTDRQTLDLAARLERLAETVWQAKDHIAREYAATDGMAAGAGDDGSRSTDGTSTVERTVIARAHLAGNAAQINDDLDTIDNIIRSCIRTCNQAIGTRAPRQQERCTANPGLDGYSLPLPAGWHDPLCTNPPRSSTGLCDACRMRLARWRIARELKPIADERIVTIESYVRAGELGVMHALPTRVA